MKTTQNKLMTDVTTNINQLDEVVNDEIAKVTLGIGGLVTGLITIWAVACMVGGLLSGGIGNAVKGYMTAITG